MSHAAKRETQGYLAQAERPGCGNCLLHKADGCGHGKFGVEADGWCPLWFPGDAWVHGHELVARKLGITLGHGNVTTMTEATCQS